MKTIYIAGPITGTDNNNEGEFFKAHTELLHRYPAAIIHNPQVIGRKLEASRPDREPSWVEYMIACIPVLIGCNSVYMLRGWRKSKGARLEHMIAEFLGLDIAYQDCGRESRRALFGMVATIAACFALLFACLPFVRVDRESHAPVVVELPATGIMHVDADQHTGFLNTEEVMASFYRIELTDGGELYKIEVERFGFNKPMYHETATAAQAIAFLEGLRG